MTIDVTNPASWPVFMTVEEVAAVFRLRPSTVQQYAARGSPAIPAPSARRPYRWQRSAVAKRAGEPVSVSALRRVG
jgi:hypothetical protein